MSKSYLDKTGVGTLSSLMKKEIKNTVESTKEQLFVVTVTSNGSQPEESDDGFSIEYTPSATFEEAVAQVKSGKKVIIGRGDDLGTYVQMHYASGPNLLLSDDKTSFLIEDENIKTFNSLALQHFQWSGGGLVLIVSKTLPSWIKDTKPTYTASEVGADKSGAATQALTDAKAYADTGLAEKENKALYITMEDGDYDSSTGRTPVTFSESYETVSAALKAGKRVLTCDTFGNPGELYFSDFLDSIVGSINYLDSVGGRGIYWNGEQDRYTEEFPVTKPPKRAIVTLRASGWDSNAKTQTVTVIGVSADESAQVIQPIPTIASQSAYYAAGILATGQTKNQVTFTATTIPTTSLNIYVVVTEVTE